MSAVIVTGVLGQDGSYLAELLLDEGYEVHGVYRRISSGTNFDNVYGFDDHDRLHLIEGDITDYTFVQDLVGSVRPDMYFNLAAMSVHPETWITTHRDGYGTRVRTIESLWSSLSSPDRVEQVRVSTEGGEVDAEVININTGQLKALGYWAGMGTFGRLKQVSRHWFKGRLVRLRQKWGEILVTPNHSVFDEMGQLRRPTDNPKLLPMRRLNYHNRSPLTEIVPKAKGLVVEGNRAKALSSSGSIVSLFSEHDGTLAALLRFGGAFVAEGWTTHNKANGSYIVAICQQDKSWLKELQNDLSLFCDAQSCLVKHKKDGFDDVWRLECSSKSLYILMRFWFGHGSEDKHLPPFVFDLNPELVRNTLLNKMLEGDGSFDKRKTMPDLERYTTVSQRLAAEVCLLFTTQGWDYTYSRNVYDNGWKDRFDIRRTRIHQPNQGDRFYEEIDYEGWVYDISVEGLENFCAGLGNVVVHNSHVGHSFKIPTATFRVDAEAVIAALDIIRRTSPETRFYQASTSELFGGVNCPPTGYDENAAFHPRSPYAVAKLAAHHAVINFREAYGIFACSGILFNHSSPRRGFDFATRKITDGVAAVKLGLQDHVEMGNMAACRDEGHAKDYVLAQYLMLQQDTPEDYVIATGESHSIGEQLEYVCSLAGLDYDDVYKMNPAFMRPSDVPFLLGNPTKAREQLGWEPEYDWKALLSDMYENDLRILGGADD